MLVLHTCRGGQTVHTDLDQSGDDRLDVTAGMVLVQNPHLVAGIHHALQIGIDELTPGVGRHQHTALGAIVIMSINDLHRIMLANLPEEADLMWHPLIKSIDAVKRSSSLFPVTQNLPVNLLSISTHPVVALTTAADL